MLSILLAPCQVSSPGGDSHDVDNQMREEPPENKIAPLQEVQVSSPGRDSHDGIDNQMRQLPVNTSAHQVERKRCVLL